MTIIKQKRRRRRKKEKKKEKKKGRKEPLRSEPATWSFIKQTLYRLSYPGYYDTYLHSEHLSLSQRRCHLTRVKILECNNQENSTIPLGFPLSATSRTKFLSLPRVELSLHYAIPRTLSRCRNPFLIINRLLSAPIHFYKGKTLY